MLISEQLASVIELLELAQITPARHVADLQKIIRSTSVEERESNPMVWTALEGLAYDLEYYEPDLQKRAEDASFYGEDRAIAEISDAISEITKNGLKS